MHSWMHSSDQLELLVKLVGNRENDFFDNGRKERRKWNIVIDN